MSAVTITHAAMRPVPHTTPAPAPSSTSPSPSASPPRSTSPGTATPAVVIHPSLDAETQVERDVHVAVDNSNIFFGAQCLPDGSADRSVRVSIKELIRFIEKGRWISTRVVAGAMRTDRISAEWAKYDYKTLTVGHDRDAYVDEILHAQILRLVTGERKPGVLVIVTGDGNKNHGRSSFRECVTRALERGWIVELCSWDRCLNSVYEEIQAAFPTRMVIRRLDSKRPRLTFKAPSLNDAAQAGVAGKTAAGSTTGGGSTSSGYHSHGSSPEAPHRSVMPASYRHHGAPHHGGSAAPPPLPRPAPATSTTAMSQAAPVFVPMHASPPRPHPSSTWYGSAPSVPGGSPQHVRMPVYHGASPAGAPPMMRSRSPPSDPPAARSPPLPQRTLTMSAPVPSSSSTASQQPHHHHQPQQQQQPQLNHHHPHHPHHPHYTAATAAAPTSTTTTTTTAVPVQQAAKAPVSVSQRVQPPKPIRIVSAGADAASSGQDAGQESPFPVSHFLGTLFDPDTNDIRSPSASRPCRTSSVEHETCSSPSMSARVS